MRIPRIFHSSPIMASKQISLDQEAANHIGRVLRMKADQELVLFDGSGSQFSARILEANKKTVIVDILNAEQVSVESPLDLHLGQVISRGDKMEFTIQKSVELGVNIITPLISERCGVKLNAERLDKKQEQWQKIAISACEQCGRNIIPEIRPTIHLETWAAEAFDGLKLNLHPRANASINQLAPTKKIKLLIGPEGGLSSQEIERTRELGFTETLLGPRVLRTETAALTAISALQIRFGDLG